MNDLLEILQADITAILTATPELADAVVLADNEGDIEAKVARALAAIQGGPTAKRGLAVVVLLPEVTETEQNLPGPPLLVRCEIRTIEHVLVNRGTGGTGLRSSQAALATLAALHHHSIGPNILFAENDALTPVEVKPGHVSHAVTLFHRANGLQGPGKVAAVQAQVTQGPQTGLSVVINGITIPMTESAVVNGRVSYVGAYGETLRLVETFGSLGWKWESLGSDPGGNPSTYQAWYATPGDVPLEEAAGWHGFSGTGTFEIIFPGEVMTLTCATAGASIRYTTDGSYPTPGNGTLFSAPFAAPDAGTLVRAAAYKTGLNPGDCTDILITED